MAAARAENLLPLGLAQGCVLRRDVRCGQPIRYDDVEAVPDTQLTRLRREQDDWCFTSAAQVLHPAAQQPETTNQEPRTKNQEPCL